MFLSIIIAFFSLVALAILHEFGHFILAKKFGVKVEEFGIGYPPRIFAKKIGETIYSLNLLPFGAMVRVKGEEENIESLESFTGKPIWQRALIVFGGVASFWLIAAIILSVVFAVGVNEVINDEVSAINSKVQIVAIAQNSPSQAAGLKAGDAIIKVSAFVPKGTPASADKQNINKVKDFQDFTKENLGQEIIVTIQRGKETLDIYITPRSSPPAGEGPLGVALVRTAIKNYPWWLAPIKGVEATFNITILIIKGFGQALASAFRGLPTGVEFIGPVGIGSLIAQATQLGVAYFLQFIALIAIYMAIFNILPIPAVDGGKLLFLAIEKIKGKPIKQRIEQSINAVFFALIILLSVVVTIKDIAKLF